MPISYIKSKSNRCKMGHKLLRYVMLFFHIKLFTKSFALFPQIKFCSGRRFPLMGIKYIYARKNHGEQAQYKN